jgi:Asp-tRNA(Asn)/Glu-tRNA(Gln) amidotransferase A subunit family amidase
VWILWRSLLGDAPVPNDHQPFQSSDLRDTRIGIVEDYFFTWLQPAVRDRTNDAIAVLGELGATAINVPWPLAAAARSAAFIINRVETAFVHEHVALAESERFKLYGEDLRLRVAAGRAIPATLYLDAVRTRAKIGHTVDTLFAGYNLNALLVPALPTVALPADDLTIENTGLVESIGAAWTRLTMPFNATGQPVLSVTGGLSDDGMPIGLQLAGASGNENMLFRIGSALERALGTTSLSPPLLENITAARSPAGTG